jgi:hypothetical protein
MPLRHLSHLHIYVCFQQPQALLHLARLPALRQLRLSYFDIADAAATAEAWLQLPQLDHLLIVNYGPPPSRQQMEALLPGLAAATSLTDLLFDGCVNPMVFEAVLQEEPPAAVCAS